jgi:hypothetical protein
MVERHNQTVVGMARSMMKAKKIPVEFWGETVTMTVFILNRAPTKAWKGKMPFEAWHGRKPNVSFLKTFGCVGHVKNTKPHLGKLEPCASVGLLPPMVLLDFEEGSKAYRLYDPKGGRVVVSRDVVFDEMAAWDWEDQGVKEAASGSSTFAVEHLVIQGGGDDGVGEQAAAGERLERRLLKNKLLSESKLLLESSLHQQRCTHLNHSPLRWQDRGHLHWSSPLHPLTSTSMWMPSTMARRSSSSG